MSFARTVLHVKQMEARMSYAERLEAAKQGYPFAAWRDKALQHGLDQYTDENCDKAKALLDALLAGLVALGEDAPEAEKVARFKTAVLGLNDLNATDDTLIETGEREELCQLFDAIAATSGIMSSKYGAGDGIASEWRDW